MLYIFDRKEVLKGMLLSGELTEATQTEILNDRTSLSFTITIDTLPKMKDIDLVGHKDLAKKGFYQIYKIISEKVQEREVSYECILLPFYELNGNGIILDKRPQNVQASAAMKVALEGSRWEVGITEPTALSSTNYYRSTRLEAISKILEKWDIELEYRFEIQGNKIVKRYVDIYNKRGKETGKRFVYGDKAISVVRETSNTDIYTAVIGRGKGLETDSGGYERKLEFGNVTWSTANGDPVNKPLGQIWVEIPEMTKAFGYSDGTPIFKVVNYDSIEDPNELLRLSYRDLEINSRPKVHFKLQAIGAEGLEIGDTVGVIRNDVEILYHTRVFQVKRDLIAGVVFELDFGDDIEYSQSKRNKALRKKIENMNSVIAGAIAK
ncbi:phage tail protein [Peptostreptococcaceae bacterium OttesenSCG-928-C18]|nr:phage tail protein [Peptostreptococcaceae bacterium OttesenSCG-928-C18]